MKTKHQSYVVGYYGMSNSGDDALMCATDLGCQMLIPDGRHLISSAAAHHTSLNSHVCVMPDISIKGVQRFLHYRNALQSANVIFGGGSVLHSKRDIQLKHHLVKLANGAQSRCVGVGIEPFSDTGSEKACAKLLTALPFVGVRDKQSYEIATAISPKANVHLTFDLAPTLLTDRDRLVVKQSRQGIAFNFCPKPIDAFGRVDPQSEGRRIARATALVNDCARQLDEPVYLVDFHGAAGHGDVSVHGRIMDALPPDINVTHLPYNPDPFRLLTLLSGFKAMVGMRLHAAILSFMVGTPCISINYHNKCTSWCQQVGTPPHYQFSSEDFTSVEVLDALNSGLGTGFAKSRLTADEARSLALRNWRKMS